MNVFVLSTGRCGSTAFVAACAHARNYTAGHETRAAFLGDNRLAYPDRHIESDNRLSWLLGRLERAFGDRAYYVHLTRDREATAASYNRRWHIPVGILPAYAESILMGNRDRGIATCRDYWDTVEANIAAFLKDKTRVQHVALETVERDFPVFWERIGAEGDLDLALAEWRIVHNRGSDRVPESVGGARARAAWEAAPENAERLRELASFLLDSGATSEAAELLEGVLARPGLAEAPREFQDVAARLAETAFARAAQEALDTGRYARARGLSERLDALTRARSYLPLARPTQAISEAVAGAAPREGSEATRLREAGDQALQAGRAREAVDAYRRSLALEPNQPRVLNNVGIVVSRSDWGQALHFFEAAQRADPQHPGIHANLAIALAESGQLPAAADLIARRDSLVPYPVASDLMARFAREDAGQRLPESVAGLALLERLAETLGYPLDTDGRVLSVFANYLHPAVPWREAALDRLSDAQMREWVDASGVQTLRDALAGGRGAVLVLSHLAAERAATLALARMGFRLNSLEFRNRLGDHGIRGAARVRVWQLQGKEGFALREVYLARQALLKGEVFQLAGDGWQGGSRLNRTFLGRDRPFRTGFAELALAAGVPVFPVFCTLAPSGRLRLAVEDPLDEGTPELPHRERVARLVGDYAGRLERIWREHPENLVWDHIRRYFELPPVAD